MTQNLTMKLYGDSLRLKKHFICRKYDAIKLQQKISEMQITLSKYHQQILTNQNVTTSLQSYDHVVMSFSIDFLIIAERIHSI